MTTRAFQWAFLLAAVFFLQELAFGQQAAAPDNLPEAPQPSVPEPVQAPPAILPTQSVTVNGKERGITDHPGFPPVILPGSSRMPVPPDSRHNIPGVLPGCQPDSSSPAQRVMSCQPGLPMFSRFLNSAAPLPLTPKQKLILASRNVIDPSNLITIAGLSAIHIASDSRTPYGPGMPGFARDAGVTLTQDMTGEFFGTFLIPSLVHQDPHYHRMPNLSVRRRLLHVVDAVVVAQSDSGVPMFNYANVVGTICTNAMGNLYVPGRNKSFGASAARISISLATGPIGNAITEFVPDLARRVNFQVVIVQRVINRVAIAEGGAQPQQ